MQSDLAIYMNYNYDISNPSVRLRRLNIRKPLRELGVAADIILRFEDLAPYKNILLSHLDKDLPEQCRNLRKQGKKLYFCHSEWLWDLPFQTEIFNLCDYIVCCSKKLADLTQSRITSPFTKCIVIEDMAEQSDVKHVPRETDSLQIVFVGMGGNSYLAKQLKPIIEELGMKLTIITEHADADIKWELDTYLNKMSQFDVAICPQNISLQPAKSAVKVCTAMGVGLPTISSPNPAYLDVVKNGVNGFIATTFDDWRDALIKMKDVKLRQKMSQEALETAKNFTPKAIAIKWKELLVRKDSKNIALINNTLRQKYLSYGDTVLDNLRLAGYDVEEFRYEDIDTFDKLPPKDLYLFIEVRYNPEDISCVYPKVLYTRENQDLNNLPHFDLIVSDHKDLVDHLNHRGFVNVVYTQEFSANFIFENLKRDFVAERKKHNIDLHTAHINSFYNLQPPEVRWPGLRDKQHIDFTTEFAPSGANVLDIGSADGWLSVYLAKEKRNVSALEFVDRGIEWTKQQAARFNTSIDVRKGCFEDILEIFADKKFDCILAYEILEHLDYLKLPVYLEKMENLLDENGKILISLPSQNLVVNDEHLWSPSEKLIKRLFKNKPNCEIRWVALPDANVPGNWFIMYQP